MLNGLQLDFRWVVPVHASCHQSIGKHGIAALTYIQELLAGANSLQERMKLSAWFHDRGYYWIAVLINVHTLFDSSIELGTEERRQRLRYLFSSGAGIRGCQNLPKAVMPSPEDISSAEVALHLTNLKATRGQGNSSLESYQEAVQQMDRMNAATRRSLEGQRFLREAQVFRKVRSAIDAKSAVTTKHGVFTSLTLQSLLAMSIKKHSVAEQALDDLIRHWEDISWLYRAQTWFMQALMLIQTHSKDYKKIYQLLIRAQFTYVFLALQLSITPYIVMQDPPYGRSWEWTPADLLVSYFTSSEGSSSMRDPDECWELRQLALTELYDDIRRPMQGEGEGVPQRGKNYKERLNDVNKGWCIKVP